MIGEINPTLRRRKLAAELRRLREGAGLNGVLVSQALHWSTSKLSRLETGQVVPSVKDVGRLLTHYRTADTEADLLLELAENHTAKGWWDSYADVLSELTREYIGMEDGAGWIKAWGSNVLPALLQTRSYAMEMAKLSRALEMVPPGKTERRTRARIRRQQLLSGDLPLTYTAVIDEAVLRRRFGGADQELMREQLQHLLKLGDRPNIAIHVLLLEDEERVYRYSVIFDLLREAALDEEASRDRIASLAGL